MRHLPPIVTTLDLIHFERGPDKGLDLNECIGQKREVPVTTDTPQKPQLTIFESRFMFKVYTISRINSTLENILSMMTDKKN